PAAPRVQVIREIADHRVEDGVGDERHHDAEPDPRFGQAEHLVVVEQEKEGEAVVLDAERHGAESVEDLRPHAQAGRAGAHGARDSVPVDAGSIRNCLYRHVQAPTGAASRASGSIAPWATTCASSTASATATRSWG